MQAQGHNGTVSFDGVAVTITRAGFHARTSIGQGPQYMPVSKITAVQFKRAGFLGNGVIQFTLGGGNESRPRSGSQTIDAARDENSAVYRAGQQRAFEQLRDAVKAALAVLPVVAPAPRVDAEEQLRRLWTAAQPGDTEDQV